MSRGHLMEGVAKIDARWLGPVAFRALGERVLMTSWFGDWLVLDRGDFEGLVQGQLAEDSPLREQLREGRMLHGELEQHATVRAVATLKAHLLAGPRRHTLMLSGMGRETAERAVDTAFMTTSPVLTLELVATEGVDEGSWAILETVVGYVEDKNRLARKRLEYVLRAPAEGLEATRLEWLVARGVRLDLLVGGAGDADVLAELSRLEADPAPWLYLPGDADLEGLRGLVEGSGAAVVRLDFAVDLSALEGPERAYAVAEWVARQNTLVDTLLSLEQGPAEYIAAVTAAKALLGRDPDVPELRSPAADGAGQLVYGPEGTIYTSEIGQALAAHGEELLVLGRVGETGYHDLVTHPTVRALLVASALEGQPCCAGCAFRPYCGVSPGRALAEQGSIQGRPADSAECAAHQGAFDHFFAQLQTDGARARLEQWARRVLGEA